MLSTHDFGEVVRILPPLRRVQRQSRGPRTVGVQLVPRSVVGPRNPVAPRPGRVLVECTAALAYGVPFYGVSFLSMVRAALRRRRQHAGRRRMDYAAGVGGGQRMPG